MQLYIYPPSANSLRCQAVANQVGIELELISVDLQGDAQLSDEFVALNPNHKIPTLVDDDFVLWESNAIMLYLGGQNPASNLIPEDLKERAELAKWLFWDIAHMGPTCSIFTYENMVKKLFDLGDPDTARLEQGKEELARFGTVLDNHLKGRDTLVGSSVTLADHAIVSLLVHAEEAEIPLGDYDEIQRWSARILASDAWLKAWQPLGVKRGGK